MLNIREVELLRSIRPDHIVDNLGALVATRFVDCGTPVVIAARNEEADLPATLLSLSLSEVPVMPIVVENGSHDRTFEVAQRMGAIALRSPVPSKVAALQHGVSFIQSRNQYLGPVLFTDGDTLVGKKWASALLSGFPISRDRLPAVVGGGSFYWNGDSKRIDLLRSSHNLIKSIAKAITKKIPIVSGHNMAIDFANNSTLIREYLQLDKDLFINEEQAIASTVASHGGSTIRLFSRSAVVVTRGDRYRTIRDVIATLKDVNYRNRKKLYIEDYGATFKPHVNP